MVPVLGATGSGKSTYLRRLLTAKPPARLLVWNPMQDKTPYPGTVLTRLEDLHQAIQERRFSVVFVPAWGDFKLMRRQFDLFCELALAAENLTFIAEEIKHVTTPVWAPPHWRRITGDGRQYGLRVFCTSQRPAQIDKDCLSNATLIRTGRFAWPDDVQTVARYMRVPEAEIDALKPLDFIEVNLETGQKLAGRLKF